MHDEMREGREREEAEGRFDPAEALETVKAFAREHPHAALAGACVAGFVLGGGVTPRLLGAVSLFVARRYMRLAIADAIETVRGELETVVRH